MIKKIQVTGLDKSTWDDFNKRVKGVNYYDDNCNCKSVKKPDGYDYYKDYAYCVSTDIRMWGIKAIFRVLFTNDSKYIFVQDCNYNALLTALTWYCERYNIEWSFSEVPYIPNNYENYYKIENLEEWTFLRKEILQRLGFSARIDDKDFVYMKVYSEMATFSSETLTGEEIYFFKNGNNNYYAVTYDKCTVSQVLLSKFFRKVNIEK